MIFCVLWSNHFPSLQNDIVYPKVVWGLFMFISVCKDTFGTTILKGLHNRCQPVLRSRMLHPSLAFVWRRAAPKMGWRLTWILTAFLTPWLAESGPHVVICSNQQFINLLYWYYTLIFCIWQLCTILLVIFCARGCSSAPSWLEEPTNHHKLSVKHTVVFQTNMVSSTWKPTCVLKLPME